MTQNTPTGYKRIEAKPKRSIFSLYFKDGVLNGMNLVMILGLVIFLGAAIYFATQFYDLFLAKRSL